MTTDTPQAQIPCRRSEINLIILQININENKNKLEELKLLIHDTRADIIAIQETKLTSKANTPNVHNFTTVRADRLHNAGGGRAHYTNDRQQYIHYNRHTFNHQYTQHRTSNGQGTH